MMAMAGRDAVLAVSPRDAGAVARSRDSVCGPARRYVLHEAPANEGEPDFWRPSARRPLGRQAHPGDCEGRDVRAFRRVTSSGASALRRPQGWPQANPGASASRADARAVAEGQAQAEAEGQAVDTPPGGPQTGG